MLGPILAFLIPVLIVGSIFAVVFLTAHLEGLAHKKREFRIVDLHETTATLVNDNGEKIVAFLYGNHWKNAKTGNGVGYTIENKLECEIKRREVKEAFNKEMEKMT